MSTISVSIPSDDEKALVAAATMLLTVAGKIPAINLDDDAADTLARNVTVNTSQPPAPPAAQEPAVQPPAPPAAPQQTNGVDLGKDSNGNMIPWDARIHSGAKTKNNDGSWKKKKGVSKDIISVVESELVSLMAVPAPQQTSQPPALPAAPQQTNGTGPTNYAELLTQVSALIQSGKITIEKVNEQVIANDVQSLQHLAMRPDLIPNVWQSIQGSLNG